MQNFSALMEAIVAAAGRHQGHLHPARHVDRTMGPGVKVDVSAASNLTTNGA